MNYTIVKAVALSLCWLALFGTETEARPRRRSETDPRLVAGLRMHSEQKDFRKLPYENGDLSYMVAYEFHEQASFLQMAVGYAPSVSGTMQSPEEEERDGREEVDYVVTPQISLIWKDQAWRGGVGLLRSLVVGEDSREWTSLYWQLLLGLNLPVVGSGVDVTAYYVFDRWGNIPNFRGDNFDFGLSIGFAF